MIELVEIVDAEYTGIDGSVFLGIFTATVVESTEVSGLLPSCVLDGADTGGGSRVVV